VCVHALALGRTWPCWRLRCRRLLLLDSLGEPVEALVEAGAVGGAARLDVTRVRRDEANVKAGGDLLFVHGVREVLLVGEHEQDRVLELGSLEHAPELGLGLGETCRVGAIDRKDHGPRVDKVVSPQASNLRPASQPTNQPRRRLINIPSAETHK